MSSTYCRAARRDIAVLQRQGLLTVAGVEMDAIPPVSLFGYTQDPKVRSEIVLAQRKGGLIEQDEPRAKLGLNT